MAKKITELTALASPAGADVLPIVDDPGGTPVTKKVTVDNLLALAKPTIGNEVSGGTADRVLFVEDDGGTPVLADSAGLTYDGSLLTVSRSSAGATASIENSGTDSLAILALKNDAREWRTIVDGAQSDSWILRDETAGEDRIIVDSNGSMGIDNTPLHAEHKLVVNGVFVMHGAFGDFRSDNGVPRPKIYSTSGAGSGIFGTGDNLIFQTRVSSGSARGFGFAAHSPSRLVAQIRGDGLSASETSLLLLLRRGSGSHELVNVEVGGSDSGGTGKRALVIDN